MAIEATGVLWVHYAERNQAAYLFVVSVIQAIALVYGIGEGIKALPMAAAYVLGYGFGALSGLWIKKRLAML